MKKNISLDDKKKISLFCNVDSNNIIQALDVDSIYEIPSLFFKEKLDERVLYSFGIKNSKLPNLKIGIILLKNKKI